MPRDFQRPFALPRGATELILIRHGSSRVWMSQAGQISETPAGDPDLSELGMEQAERLGERLRTVALASIYVTPLRRTWQTAAPAARAHQLEPIVVDDLREVFLGEWDHCFNERMAARDPLARELFDAERWDVIPGAEEMEHFAERVRRGIAYMVGAAGPDQTVAAVVHAGVIAEACRQVTASRPFAFLAAENCSLTRVMRSASGRWTLLSFNDTAHL